MVPCSKKRTIFSSTNQKGNKKVNQIVKQQNLQVLGQFPRGQLLLGQFPPRTFASGQFPPTAIAPWIIPFNNSHLELLYCSRIITTRLLLPRANDSYKLQFFHDYFMFLFHGPIISFLLSVMTTKIIMIVVIKHGV